MEVATTNNHHSQSHHHHHHNLQHNHHHHHRLQHNNQHSRVPQLALSSTGGGAAAVAGAGSGAGVVAISGSVSGSGARSPFQREVREWQRIDPETGALLTGRLEADRWINGPLNSYGKISDSQNISQPNGTQHTQRKQLEVLQARTANGSMQVIRAQTVQTTSSRWSSASASTTPSPALNGSPYYNQHSHHHQHNHHNNSPHHHQPHHQQHRHSPHLAETSTRWPQLAGAASQLSTASVDICEVSDDSDGEAGADESLYVIDGAASSSSAASTVNEAAGGNLFTLLDTAPSLKLSNLMKSSSSISSNNSSNNSTIATTTPATTKATAMNTHKSAGKISLHAIVGNETKSSSSSSSTTTAALSPTTTTPPTTATAASWQHQHQHQSHQQQQQQQRSSRLFEQPALYGSSGSSNNRRSLTKSSRVGVSDCDETVGGGGGVADELHRRHRQAAENDRDDDDLTPTQPNRQPRRDLESFRHCNDHGGDDHHRRDDHDDDALRPTLRHQRRQQLPQLPSSPASTPLQRSRSISTDDLSTEWDSAAGAADEEPGEWRRVSKLRRSFQSSSTASGDAYNAAKTTPRRPLDLPPSSVSVSRIRAELENGRRLNTAMRNNHVDLAALDTILNAPKSPTTATPAPAKRSSFLTAESLKEIRGKLKKLSDESLYRDDFHAPQPHQHQQPLPDIEQIEVVQQLQPARKVRQLRQLTPEQSPEIEPPKSAFLTVAPQQPQQQAPLTNGVKPATNSLESRQKHKDTASSEWHLRRKSYGFEKMSPPDEKASMGRMDASTDSGLGRSGELGGNWSPTESAAAARATVVHFGEPARTVANSGGAPVARRYRPLKSPLEAHEDANKRHSIAVDESRYVRENLRRTSQVHLTGFYDPANASQSLQSPSGASRYDVVESAQSSTTLFQRNGQQKRVEFCKTEVHFAAESGRVNIVETDGKPPPTNNFRRRRRTTSGPLQSLVKAAAAVDAAASLPMTLFGDDRKTLATATVAYSATLPDAHDHEQSSEPPPPTSVTVSVPKIVDTYATLTESSRSSYASTSGIDTATDCEADDIAAIRGILKNKPIKPRPYHLGENFDTPDALWGVQLKPIGSTTRPESLADSAGATLAPSSVAERVRIVEKRQEPAAANGYSTKINLSLGESPNEWHEAGVHCVAMQRRPSAQELVLQDLREHQRILDEGLKSTSLIIKTMRSANEFDAAMRRLSIASLEATTMPPIVVPTPMLRSNSYQDSSARRGSNTALAQQLHLHKSSSFTSTSSTMTTTTTTRRFSSDSFGSFVAPIAAPPVAAPRMKLLGNTQTPVSQQLSQLRRLYEAATSQDDDSADEEVKSYFRGHGATDNSDSGGGTQESSSLEDDRSVEYSSSWSRLKAKRTIWKIEADAGKCEKIFDRAELPKSNVMNIELHSPQSTLSRVGSFKATHSPPVPKPRIAATAHQSPQRTTAEPIKEPLKIVKEARGARKLREHELSYFGVQVAAKNDANHESRTKSLTTMTNTPTKRSLPQRKPSASETQATLRADLGREKNSTKWQLINDKPDLLRHSPIVVEPQIVARTAELKPHRSAREEPPPEPLDSEADDDEEHFYENISNELTPVFKVKPSTVGEPYDRKMDHQRDVQILSEMTRNADQTLKALSDEAAVKSQRRRSLQRRNSKPLETINEKSIGEKIGRHCIAVKVSRGTVASEARRTTSRHSTPSPTTVAKGRVRTSSQSSVESCPRARSRSLSSEREYENVRVKPTQTRVAKLSKHAKAAPAAGSRSSSLDSHRSSHTQCSSGDEGARREERVRSKPKRISGAVQSRERHSREQHDATARDSAKKSSHRSSLAHSERTHASGTKYSSQRERIECSREAVPPQRTHRRAVDATSSSRRRRTEPEAHRSAGGLAAVRSAPGEKHDRHEHMTNGSGSRSVRSARGQEHEAVQRSSHRSERSGEKEKLSRSRGHSNRSSSTHRSERHAGSLPIATPTTKSREHKKSLGSTTTSATTNSGRHGGGSGEAKQFDDPLTHSKNAQIVNGHHHGDHHHQPYPGTHHPHIPSMTTTTIAAKQRETRNGKDRK